MAKGTVDAQLVWLLSQPSWVGHPELVRKLIEKKTVENELSTLYFTSQNSNQYPELLSEFIEKSEMKGFRGLSGSRERHLYKVFQSDLWTDHPELLKQLIEKGTDDEFIATRVFSQSHWNHHPELLELLIDKGTADSSLSRAFADGDWSDHPELLRKLILKGTANGSIGRLTLTRDQWKDHPELVVELVKQIIKNTPSDKEQQKYAYSTRADIDGELLSKPIWKDNAELRKICRGRKVTFANIAKGLGLEDELGICFTNRIKFFFRR